MTCRWSFTAVRRIRTCWLYSVIGLQQPSAWMDGLRDHGIEARVESGGMGLEFFELKGPALWVRVQKDKLQEAEQAVERFAAERRGKQQEKGEGAASEESPMGKTQVEKVVWVLAFCIWVFFVLWLFTPSYSGGGEAGLAVCALAAMPIVVLVVIKLVKKRRGNQ